MRYNLITIEGNIGAGKTTLARKLAEDFNARLILEEFSDNPFLPKFYEDPDRHAFALELSFMAERYQQLKLQAEPELFNQLTITDYVFYKSLIFASVTLGADEARLYRRLFDIINPTLVQPQVILYLWTPVEVLMQNIAKRGRDYEQKIQPEYLEKVHQKYMDFFRQQQKSRILILDTTKFSYYDDPTHYQRVLEVLNNDYPIGIHFME